MGIGRRDFIRLFGASLSAMASRECPAVGLFEELYLNRKLRLAFRRPAGWTFVDIDTMGQMQAGVLLAAEDELSQMILKLTDLPFATIVQDNGLSHAFTPSAQFYLRRMNDDPFILLDQSMSALESFLNEFEGGRPAKDQSAAAAYLLDDIEACQQLLHSYHTITPPTDIRLSSCDAAEATATYMFAHEELASSVPIRQRSIYIEQEEFGYLIRMTDAPEQGQSVEFDALINSIRIL